MSDGAGARSGTPAESGSRPERGGGLLQPVTAGLLAALVGFASTFALVLQALGAVGASRAEAASGLFALLLATGVVAVALSVWSRLPISIAWSTPGAALLVATGAPAGGFPAATGAFLIASLTVVGAGLWRPFGRAVAAIPASLASAMLAGVLLDLCLAPVRAVSAMPALALPIVLAWAVAMRFARLYAVPIAVVATAAMVAFATPFPDGTLAGFAPQPVFVVPVFEPSAIVGISLPLFIVTMASQNIPGLAVLHSNGYAPPVGPILVVTGIGSAAVTLLGGHLVNLAAITAALCAGPDAHPDRSRRWIAAAASGVGYISLGFAASLAAAFVAASPPLLIQAVAGLALLASLGAAIQSALARETERTPAIVTFVTTASGVSLLGIGAAFWGLVAGGAMLALDRVGRGSAVRRG